ncbi:MAG: hypothetical protein ACRC3J_05305 [Culicoidibacterales bacterium]
MHIFNRKGKINFIDDNNVFVGWDESNQCCEYARWLFVTEIPKANEMLDAYDTHKTIKDFHELVFKHTTPIKVDCSHHEDSAIALPLCMPGVNQPIKAYLILANKHSGYYSHGFTVGVFNEIEKGSV